MGVDTASDVSCCAVSYLSNKCARIGCQWERSAGSEVGAALTACNGGIALLALEAGASRRSHPVSKGMGPLLRLCRAPDPIN